MKKSDLRPNGSRKRPPGGYEAFWRAVAEAARKKRRKPNQTPAQLANLRPIPPELAGRGGCVAIAGSTGKQCRLAPVKGGARCQVHGGLFEVPNHRANIAAVDEGRRSPDWAEARRAYYEFDRSTRKAVEQAYDAVGRSPRRRPWPTLLIGAQAITADVTGAAFRRWIENIRST